MPSAPIRIVEEMAVLIARRKEILPSICFAMAPATMTASSSGRLISLMLIWISFLADVMVFMLVLQLAGVAAFALTLWFGRQGGLRPMFKAIERALIGLHQGLTTPIVTLETALVVTVGIWLSYRLSVVMAERRDA